MMATVDTVRRETPEEQAEITRLKENVLRNHKLKQKCLNCNSTGSTRRCNDHVIKWIKERDDGKSSEVKEPLSDMDLNTPTEECKKKHPSKASKLACTLAHGKLEYYVWNDIRLVMKAVLIPRLKPPRLQPTAPSKLCTNMTQKGRCDYGDNCDYPHSENELKLWKEEYIKDKEMHGCQLKELKDKLFRTHKLQTVCTVCLEENNGSLQSHGIHINCPQHKDAGTTQVYPAKVRPLPASPNMELCEYRISTCKNGINCLRAHSEFELFIWKDEQEINRAVRQPRKEPIEFRTLQMCKAMKQNGRCDYRANCKFAHSQNELKEWEKHIQELKEYIPTVIEDTTIETLDTISRTRDKKSLRLALDLLLAEETRRYNGSTPIHTMDRATNAQTALRFLNVLAKCLHLVVFSNPSLKEQFEVDSDEEHQEMDVRKLLDVIRHNQETSDLVYCYATLLIAICHRIAHQCYLIEGKDDDLVFSPVLTGTEGFIKVLFNYGLEFILVVMDTMIESTDVSQKLKLYMESLHEINHGFKPAYI